ncbi:MAG: ABC transporter ATP-binding protein [Phycisphaerae bacterium]|nr:ABC transporter ATP-binding protein [Phycisphaerae bacterium]
MIQVRNLSKWYGPVKAVDNISFRIKEGEIVGFLGPNGAGKTTTLRILTCFMPANSGSASVAGHDVFTQSMQVREQIGYLPESVPLYPEMRVREYLNFRAKLRGLAAEARQTSIKRAAARCRVTDFIDRPIGHLSRGMRQRVGLAEALLHDPKVLILDEPTVGLDPTQIRETRNLVKELAKEHTVILSSHILPEVEATCERTIIIAGGRIVASGSPSELKERITQSSRLIAEIRGPADAVKSSVGGLNGVGKVESSLTDGWNRLLIDVQAGQDVREDIFKLASKQGWGLREIRREVASLEDFFVQITAQQHIDREGQSSN